jgi:hypothetical protein
LAGGAGDCPLNEAAGYVARGCVIDRPRSENFDVRRLIADGETVVSEMTVTDVEQSARVVAFSDLEDEPWSTSSSTGLPPTTRCPVGTT